MPGSQGRHDGGQERECCRRERCTRDEKTARRGRSSRLMTIIFVSLILLGHVVTPASGLRGAMTAWASSPGIVSSGGGRICHQNSLRGPACRAESLRAGRSLLRASSSTSASGDEEGMAPRAPGGPGEDGGGGVDDSSLAVARKGAIASVLDRQYDKEIVQMAIPSYTSMLLDPVHPSPAFSACPIPPPPTCPLLPTRAFAGQIPGKHTWGYIQAVLPAHNQGTQLGTSGQHHDGSETRKTCCPKCLRDDDPRATPNSPEADYVHAADISFVLTR